MSRPYYMQILSPYGDSSHPLDEYTNAMGIIRNGDWMLAPSMEDHTDIFLKKNLRVFLITILFLPERNVLIVNFFKRFDFSGSSFQLNRGKRTIGVFGYLNENKK